MSKKRLAIILSLSIAVLLTAVAVFSASAYSDSDPLITLSYLEQVVIPSLNNSSASGSYKLLELNQGQKIIANSICEIIARPGSYVSVISPHAAQGIANISTGTELLNGAQLPMNICCVIPRGGDGRGVKVDSKKAYILIRGDYTIG